MNLPRIAPGVSAGGQFAKREHAEVGLSLSERPRTVPGWERLLAEYPELVEVSDAISPHTPLYLVGGSIRDLASGLEAKDLDVTSALHPDDFRDRVVGSGDSAISVFDVGEAHGTTGVSFLRRDGTRVEIEHTTHRVETYEEGSRTPTVGFGTSLLADLDRRDFTINAVAVDVSSGEVVDPHGGLEDLEQGVLRTPLDPVRTFSEDPLRISRLVRFAAIRRFEVDPDTGRAATEVADRLDIVSAERKRAELVKIFDAGPEASVRAMSVADDLGIRSHVFGGLGDEASAAEVSELDLEGPEDVVAALALRSTNPVEAMRSYTFTNAEIDSARRAVAAVEDLDTSLDPAAFRAAMRRHGSATFGRAARIAVGRRFSHLEREQVERLLVDNEGFDSQPRPVDGNDAISAGLKGRHVGSALAAVDTAMCGKPTLSRDEAQRILRSLASFNGATNG